MKKLTLFVVLLLSIGVAIASPVKITADGEAYGHHGACSGWNDCGDAETCALLACEANGFNTLVSYGESMPCTFFDNCRLFSSTETIGTDLECDWNKENCAVMGVTEIVCDDGEWTGQCSVTLPDQDVPSNNGGSNDDIVNDDIVNDDIVNDDIVNDDIVNDEVEENQTEVPEFGVMAAGIGLIGAVGAFIIRRRN